MGLASLESTWRRRVDKAITDTLTDEGGQLLSSDAARNPPPELFRRKGRGGRE